MNTHFKQPDCTSIYWNGDNPADIVNFFGVDWFVSINRKLSILAQCRTNDDGFLIREGDLIIKEKLIDGSFIFSVIDNALLVTATAPKLSADFITECRELIEKAHNKGKSDLEKSLARALADSLIRSITI